MVATKKEHAIEDECIEIRTEGKDHEPRSALDELCLAGAQRMLHRELELESGGTRSPRIFSPWAYDGDRCTPGPEESAACRESESEGEGEGESGRHR